MCPALCCLIGASLNSCMELDDSVYTTIVSDKYPLYGKGHGCHIR